jgi:hypothetical protein
VRRAPRLTHARRPKRLPHNVNGVRGDDSGRGQCSYPHPENLIPLLSKTDSALRLGENTMTMPWCLGGTRRPENAPDRRRAASQSDPPESAGMAVGHVTDTLCPAPTHPFPKSRPTPVSGSARQKIRGIFKNTILT